MKSFTDYHHVSGEDSPRLVNLVLNSKIALFQTQIFFKLLKYFAVEVARLYQLLPFSVIWKGQCVVLYRLLQQRKIQFDRRPDNERLMLGWEQKLIVAKNGYRKGLIFFVFASSLHPCFMAMQLSWLEHRTHNSGVDDSNSSIAIPLFPFNFPSFH